MSTATKASQEYLKAAVAGASPEQLQVMLFDGAIRFSLRGLESLKQKDYETQLNNIERAQRIVIELGAGLNRSVNPELADRMTALYNFVYRRLVDSIMNQSETAIEEAVRILRAERDTWQLIVDKVAKEGLRGPQSGEKTSSTPSSAMPAISSTTPAKMPATAGAALSIEG